MPNSRPLGTVYSVRNTTTFPTHFFRMNSRACHAYASSGVDPSRLPLVARSGPVSIRPRGGTGTEEVGGGWRGAWGCPTPSQTPEPRDPRDGVHEGLSWRQP